VIAAGITAATIVPITIVAIIVGLIAVLCWNRLRQRDDSGR
jgi:biopolymer transport protein ExbB/TolQ